MVSFRAAMASCRYSQIALYTETHIIHRLTELNKNGKHNYLHTYQFAKNGFFGDIFMPPGCMEKTAASFSMSVPCTLIF